MYLNVVIRLLEDLLTAYHSIKRHSEFEEYFIPDHDHPSYYWNDHTYTYLGYLLLVAFTNDTCVKYFMTPQAYKVVNIHTYKILGWTILSRIIHSQHPHIGGMNDDVQYELGTMALNNREQLGYIYCRILKLQR